MSQPEPRAGRLRLHPAGSGSGRRASRWLAPVLVALVAATAVLTAFVPEPQSVAANADQGPAASVRLGYFANATHAPALVGVEQGLISQSLQADGTQLATEVFNAGPAAVEALNSGALDAAYIGPSPALTSYLSSGGNSLQVIAGATTGGASLVVSKDITEVSQLAGKNLASPQYGGTQDVALRNFLAEQGLSESTTVTPSSNGTVPQLFARGAVDGAWLPEPYASLLVENYDAHRLLDEAQLWPEGKFPTTMLVVSQRFSTEHPQSVRRLLEANQRSIDTLNAAKKNERVKLVAAGLSHANGATLDEKVLRAALSELHFDTVVPAGTLEQLMEHAAQVGIGPRGDLSGLLADTAQGERP
ncbi:ABC transporter substrate-binding protein [Glutamicibacter sp. PS]|uniref:ABC transporter substrate-binding protein n=1 Tax=Glutamicibacter sp. PS TaxID=3075634 RepID=UPI002841C072|nr:ABC transporter substrate-binding protein [Glutamicibacter sp. PS]MDR4532613.1 ABC transporter substrate-binding protein [Glutamicibacter sp. PS]